MTLKQQAARAFGAIIVLIALSLAPTLANAHTGHLHPASVAAQSLSAATHADGAASQTHSTKSHAAKNHAAKLQLAAAAQPGMADDGICHGPGCYCGAACSACCTAALTNLPFTVPPTLASSLTLPNSRAGTSIVLGGPRRPPRSFA